jgi:hypothetical protein
MVIALAGRGGAVGLPVPHRAGFAQQVGGLAPAAARYAGFSSRRRCGLALLISGGAAGLAGALEVAGPIGQLTPYVPAGYGFAAIIVAFVGRLHPVGMVFSAILMSMFYIGGELAQSRLGLPKSLTGVFQGLLLFTLLACDTLIAYRIRRKAAAKPITASPVATPPSHRTRVKGATDMESYALLFASTLKRRHRAGHRGAGPVDQREGRHRQPRRRGHDAVRRHRRLRHRWCTPATTGSASRPAWRRAHCWPAIFGVLVIWLNTNQYATGLALSLFGAGFSAFAGIKYVQEKLPESRTSRSPCWPTSRWWARRCSASTRWSTSRWRWWPGWSGSCTARAPAWCCARSANRPSRRMRWATRCAASAGGGGRRRRAVRAGGRLPVDRLHAAVGRGHGGRQGLDRAGAHHLRHLAPGTGVAWCLPVRRRDHAAVPPAGWASTCQRSS